MQPQTGVQTSEKLAEMKGPGFTFFVENRDQAKRFNSNYDEVCFGRKSLYLL